jgi:hypothetical protein
MDPSAHHSDPLGESVSYSSQRVAQALSMMIAIAEISARRKAQRLARKHATDEQAARQIMEQQRELHNQARAEFGKAHDPAWLASAGLLETGRAWAAAVAYADSDPVADAARRKCEARLRTLHPYAMAHFDQLISDGASPADAMSEAAPRFGLAPHTRTGEPPRRASIEAGRGPTPPPPADAHQPGAPGSRDQLWQKAEARGRDIAASLQDKARRERGTELSREEMITVLEETTNLPGEIIDQIARARIEEQLAATAEKERAADLGQATRAAGRDERAARLSVARDEQLTADTESAHAAQDREVSRAARSFPLPVHAGIEAAVNGTLAQPSGSGMPVSARNIRHTAVTR